METNKLFIKPRVRLLFLCLGIAGTILTGNSYLLLGFYGILILPLFIYGKQFKKHLNLMAFGMFPIFLSFVLLYIVILPDGNGGWAFITTRMLKLIIFTSVFQLTLLIPPEILITTFKKWGLKGEALLTVLGAFTVWADIKTRTDKILSARFARGFIEERTLLNKAMQLPYVLVPLVIGIIRTAIERADSWEQKNILHLLKNHKVTEPEYPFVFNGFILAGITGWFILAFYSKVIV